MLNGLMTLESIEPNRRFGREKRKAMILDKTAELIATEGTAELSLNTIGQRAGVSKTLMYRYFGSLLDLLRELMRREHRRLRIAQFEAAESAETYEDLVRKVTRAYLLYIEERGLILERLQSYPNIAGVQNPTYFEREPSVSYFAEVTAQIYDLPIEISTAATEVSFGLPAAAGEYLIRSGMDRQTVEDITVAMILGSVGGIRDNMIARQKRIQRPSDLADTPLSLKRRSNKATSK
ncbi:MAG: TetR/AcrR family transcriptional regulator [Pseudomonadota bacterium]